MVVLAWSSASRIGDGISLRFPARPWWLVLLDVMYLEVHWAFYRSALTALLGDLYNGVFLGLALVYAEWALNPAWRRGWRQQSRAAVQWLQATLALLSALVFLLTRNLWVSLVIHALLAFCLSQVGRVSASDPSPELPSIGERTGEPEEQPEE
jgi:hypothetical protein